MMLERFGALHALLEDGREKMGGDYILDRHYVESLADDAIELAGSVVFDACVLVGEGGEDLYGHYDAHRARVHGLLVSGEAAEAPGPEAEASGDADLEPEYRLLSGILEWIDGKRLGSGETLLGFIRRVLDHVASAMKEPPLDGLETETLQCRAGRVHNSIRLVHTGIDLLAPGAGNGGGAEIGHRPLRLMFEGVAQGEAANAGSRDSGEAEERTWLAVADERRLSLRRTDGSAPLRLEAYLGEAPEPGTLFLHASPQPDFEARLPPGFRVERDEGSVVAWLEDAGPERMEDGLVRLGRVLFS